MAYFGRVQAAVLYFIVKCMTTIPVVTGEILERLS